MKNIFRSIVLSSALMCGVVMITPQMTVMQEAAAAQTYAQAFAAPNDEPTVDIGIGVNAPNLSDMGTKIGNGDLGFFGTITDSVGHGAIARNAAFNAGAGTAQALFDSLKGRDGMDKKLSAKGIIDCIIKGLQKTGEIARQQYLLSLLNADRDLDDAIYAAMIKKGGITLGNYVSVLNDMLKNQNQQTNIPTGGTVDELFTNEVARLVYCEMIAAQDEELGMLSDYATVRSPAGWDGAALKAMWCNAANPLEFTTGDVKVFSEDDIKAVAEFVADDRFFGKMQEKYENIVRMTNLRTNLNNRQKVVAAMDEAYDKDIAAATRYADSVAEKMTQEKKEEVELDKAATSALTRTKSLIKKINDTKLGDDADNAAAKLALEQDWAKLPVDKYEEYSKGLANKDVAVQKKALSAITRFDREYKAPKEGNDGGNDNPYKSRADIVNAYKNNTITADTAVELVRKYYDQGYNFKKLKQEVLGKRGGNTKL